MQYARYISETEIRYPTDAEFAGIPNWREHDAKQREKGYMPLIGQLEEREGYEAEPARFRLVEQFSTKNVPYEVEIPDFDEDDNQTSTHKEWQDRETEIDTSFIEIVEWKYTAIPEPEPEQPDIDISDSDFADLPTTFSKWELIQAWEATGDLNNLLSTAGTGKQNLLAAWSSLPEEIDFTSMLTRWAIMISMASGGNAVSRDNIVNWLTWIKEHRNEQQQ